MNLVAIILTLNEERHLPRCIESLRGVADRVVVVDCFSTDQTLTLAKSKGARVVQNTWVNHATQFNWSLTQLDANTEWVIRIDADEYLTPELAAEIRDRLFTLGPEIEGVYVNRRMTFQGRMIRHGGVFPIRVLRLFRYGKGECEKRWMDEHIKVAGATADFKGDLVDDNLNSLTWWTDKHNGYASREAVDLLNMQYGFSTMDSIASLSSASQAGIKRWIKERLYVRLPGGFRAFVYFVYRYVIRLGFLDGQAGMEFHFLQGLWYRYLVDAKVAEVKMYMKKNNVDITTAIADVLQIHV